MNSDEEHYCQDPNSFPIYKFHQKGVGKGRLIMIVGESPAKNGWRKSGKAFYRPDGGILPSGTKLNELLSGFDLSVKKCGFTELVKCYVGKNKNKLRICGKDCWPIFLKQLNSVEYKMIIILGVGTLKIFNDLSGLQLEIGNLSKAKLGNKEYVFFPIYHPSPINANNHKKNLQIFDMRKIELESLLQTWLK